MCESWCSVPCGELNGDVLRECGACTAVSACYPGAVDYPKRTGLPHAAVVSPTGGVEASSLSSSGARDPRQFFHVFEHGVLHVNFHCLVSEGRCGNMTSLQGDDRTSGELFRSAGGGTQLCHGGEPSCEPIPQLLADRIAEACQPARRGAWLGTDCTYTCTYTYTHL